MTTLQAVELGVLGPLQVRQDGTAVAIPGAKPRAIITMLGLHGGSAVSADTLLELLWGDDPPRTATKALQTHISSLRRALGDGFVLTEGAGWTLAGSEIDASRYKVATRLGRAAAAAGDTSQAVVHFEEALRLWRGIPELPDGQRGSSEKTRWIEAHAALIEDRADALLATGRAAEVIGELEASVADAPLRERRWGQLMLALYRAGRQGEALGAYQRARSLLVEQLGVDPGPDLRRLEAAIVGQEEALDMPVAQQVSSVTRAVTFLLTDIEGSTAAWEAEADAMAVALARHDELVEQVVTSRGGRLIKTRGEGDATFSVFERPSAAAAAAIELQEAIAHEPWTVREPMRIRVALHTGEVELRDGDYFGRAVNRAARLRSLASGGQILCSGATAELVIDSLHDDVVLADLGMRQLRNLARPEHVFELRMQTVDDVSPAPAIDVPIERPDLPTVLSGQGPFVGRGRELGQLSSTWQTALAGGMRAVLIAGEPGVGKTRLSGEWSRQAYEQGAAVLYGRCDEDLGAPYQPFAEALRTLVPCLGAGRLRGVRGVEALLSLVPGLTDLLPDLAASTSADPDTERYALFDAVVGLLEIASASVPVVLILDDLHWAAKPTLLLLRHLLRFGEQSRVQIVGTYRSTDLDRSHPLAGMLADLHRDGTAERLQLTGLDADDVTTYVAEAGYDDEGLARALASVTAGNPFFLIEALRHVDESGGVWDQSSLPQGVREAVSRRLSRLPVETNKALAAAAVVGSRFAVELVERVVDQDLVDAFDEACKAGIVIEEPGGRYRFNHAIVRQSLLAELPSVRRMRLHQRIAATLETEPGADDELLAELAHHYFECAWAGNAAKAVDYCRRAADQAMARLAYEGAADLYDQALHALEELDDELPDRDGQTAELLVSRCEALLAAGDMASATDAVAQLQSATRDSARLAAWATCFDGQLSMLIHPERLDDVEAAVGAAAGRLAELGDAAGEAKAHTVRAGCLARLGRIGDCEIALDHALTAARRAREHRRVNAVLAGAPLAALWGPNPVPRAGGRCLDVVRLLRITTDSPAVEATSTRCQAVLEAFRGRAAAARRMIDSARRTVSELGLRHALLEVDQFAGIVELVADDPAAAEPYLRKAYNGFRRLGLDADTAETAALLGRTCLALGEDAEADELCSESQRLAGHALKASIAWRTLRAQLMSRRGEHDEARRVAEAAVALAERTDGLVDHGDACLALATVLDAAGDAAGARAVAERAADLYEQKGAAALVDKVRAVLGRGGDASSPAPPPQVPDAELVNECTQVGERLVAFVNREAWDDVEQLFAPEISVESRRKIVGFSTFRISASQWPQEMRRYFEAGMVRFRYEPIAIRGEQFALVRLEAATADPSPDAAQDELLQVVGLDDKGLIDRQVWFDVADIDDAIAELEASYGRFKHDKPRQLDNACVRVGERLAAAIDRKDWDEVELLFAPEVFIESRRKIVGFTQTDLPSGEWPHAQRRMLETTAVQFDHVVVAVRGERLALEQVMTGTGDVSRGAPDDQFLLLYGIDDEGHISLNIAFDIEDIDAATAELDATYARFNEGLPRAPLNNTATRVNDRVSGLFADSRWDEIGEIFAEDFRGDDRRRGLRRDSNGRDAAIAEMRTITDLGVARITSTPLALRGEYLCLTLERFEERDPKPDAFVTESLTITEVDSAGIVVARIAFDLDDIAAAFEELEAKYLAGEAAPHTRVWSTIARSFAALNRRELGELPDTTADYHIVDHRLATTIDTADLTALFRAIWDVTPEIFLYIEAVHQLDDIGAVITQAANGTSTEGFDAQWRIVQLQTIESGKGRGCELFEESDIDAALARFHELHPQERRLENAATRWLERYLPHFVTRDWDAMAAMLSDDICTDDRRRVVNAGVFRGRDVEMANLRAVADVGITNITSTSLATRGERVVLNRTSFSLPDWPEELGHEVLDIVEITADDKASVHVLFDADQFDAAIAELDARYLAGEAAAHARTWSVISQAHAAFNRRELPAIAPALLDHRPVVTVDAGDPTENIHAMWEFTPDLKIYIEAVHRLSDFGAVLTQESHGTSQAGFEAEWRVVELVTVEGDLMNRGELFNEADINVALARFDELHPQERRLENAASQVYERFWACFEARDWAAASEMLASDHCSDDRRHVVNAGILHGRDAVIEDMRAAATEFGTIIAQSVVIATRGDQLALRHARISGRDQRPEGFRTDVLNIVEIDADRRIAALVLIDPDDIDAAFTELDARYLAGEAAAHAHTWSAIVEAFAAINRHELPSTPSEFVGIDHRQGPSIAPGELMRYLRASWELTPDRRMTVEAVHQLSDLGAVITLVAQGTSQEGFEADWRFIELLAMDGGFGKLEAFDETDLDAALARFDELSSPTPRLENAASRAYERLKAGFVTRDWDVLRDILADDICTDVRRRVVNAGIRSGRESAIEELSGFAEIGAKAIRSDVIATRGDRLILNRSEILGGDQRIDEVDTKVIVLVEIDADERVMARVVFDVDDIDAATEELDARYLKGEAAAHARTWAAVAGGFAALNRHELPSTTPDFVDIDHRRGRTIAPGDLMSYLRAGWELNQDTRSYVEVVHRLNDLGSVVTHAVQATSQEGFDAEWRAVDILAVDGDLISRCELFDEADIDAALARFYELRPHERRLENAASRLTERLLVQFAARDWAAIAEMLADAFSSDDRRRVVNAGMRRGRDAAIQDARANAGLGVEELTSTVIATRGDRLVLRRARYSGSAEGREQFHGDVLNVFEIDEDERVAAVVTFDPDDFDAAFAELDARYLAGEVANYSHTWSVLTQANEALNQRGLPETASDYELIDHRQLATIEMGDLSEYLRAGWDLTPQARMYIGSVHQMSELGAVVTWAAWAASAEGFIAEWQLISLVIIEGDLISHAEMFDEVDLDTAIARFGELAAPARHLEDAATQVNERYRDCYTARDWNGLAQTMAPDFLIDDRRRPVNSGITQGRDSVIESMKATADLGNTNVTSTVIATRGKRLILAKADYSDIDQVPEAFRTEVLSVSEICADQTLSALVLFDLEDADAAFAELDARYLAGEAAAHAKVWSEITQSYAAMNRHEIPGTMSEWTTIDHRVRETFEGSDLTAYTRSAWDLMPDVKIRIEAVHRLSDLGVVATHVAYGTSQDGFEAEWRMIVLLLVHGEGSNGCELFNEADLEAALARFDEIGQPTSD